MNWDDRIKRLKDHRASNGDLVAFLIGLLLGMSSFEAEMDSGAAVITAILAMGVYRMFMKEG